MMMHAPVMAVAVAGLAVAAVLALFGYPFFTLAAISAGLVGILAAERFIAGVRAARKFHDRAGFFFVPVHLVRDLAWTAAIVVWLGRRVWGRTSRPAHSMHPREANLR